MNEDTLKSLIDAAQGGEWGVFTGLLLTLLVWIAARLVPLIAKKQIPREWLPWISSTVGIVGAIALALIQGQQWYAAIWSGLVVGAAASGFWSLGGKNLNRLIPAPKPSPEVEPPPEAEPPLASEEEEKT